MSDWYNSTCAVTDTPLTFNQLRQLKKELLTQQQVLAVCAVQLVILNSLIMSSPPVVQVMRKMDLIRKNMVESVKNERNILAMANNPFVVRTPHHIASLMLLSGTALHSCDCKVGTPLVCL